MKRIAILCSGGDVSGMNAALKRFVEYSLSCELEPFFVRHGFEGLIDGEIVPAQYRDVAGILSRGGTIIGSARSERFMQERYRQEAIRQLEHHQIDAMVVLGGDGSFKGMQRLFEEAGHLRFAGIPATIDNDIAGTQYCLGVDTALSTIRYNIDAIRDTASSFRRAFVIETMGRNCGYLALVSALTCGAEMCLIPEIPYRLEDYKKRFVEQMEAGRDYFIAVVSEALKQSEEVAAWFEQEIGIETRVTVLGHTQRGGITSVHDRLMASHFVTHAIDGLCADHACSVVCYDKGGFAHRKIEEVAFRDYRIDPELIALAGCYNCQTEQRRLS